MSIVNATLAERTQFDRAINLDRATDGRLVEEKQVTGAKVETGEFTKFADMQPLLHQVWWSATPQSV